MISFGSLFNPERVPRKFEIPDLDNPEHDIEQLKNDAERPKDFPAFPNELIGRSQLTKTAPKRPYPVKVELTDEDKDFLSKLSSKQYGFHPNSNKFWFHGRKPAQGGAPNMIMGDGMLPKNTSRHDFIKGLVDDKAEAFQIAGKDKLGGNKLITVVKNNKTGEMTMYTCDSKTCYPVVVDGGNTKALANAITNNLTEIQGATVWKE